MIRNVLIALLGLFAITQIVFAQVPQGVNYQAVARNSGGGILANQNISLRITILSGSATGPMEYQETHAVTTNQFGLFTLNVGDGFPVSGTFPGIQWDNANQWMRVEMDPNGTSSYVLMGTAELLSVPFALYSEQAGSIIMSIHELTDVDTTGVIPGQILQWNGTNWVPVSGTLTYYPGSGIAIVGDTIHNIIWDTIGPDIYRVPGSVGIGTNNIDSTAILHLESTTKGFLPPRMSKEQRDSINGPADGLVIYNTTDSVLQYYNGNCWMSTYMRDCNECDFTISLSNSSGIINRTSTDTASTDIFINQTNGTQAIGVFLIHNLPVGVTATLTNSTITGSGTAHLLIESTIFAKPGSYPIAVQGICGSFINSEIFTVTIDSCYEVTLIANQKEYDLQSFAGLPGPGTPVCVVVHILPGIDVYSEDVNTSAFNTGGLDTLSHVGIDNNGAILGMGGEGGAGGNFTTFGEPGEDGGDALNLTVRTSVQNNGYIYAGGGGGGSVAIELFNIPFLGSISVGAGGGGGAANGLGGDDGFIPLPIFEDGFDGTGGVSGQGGLGGNLNIPITIPISAVTITITPVGQGGNGGGYGQQGGTGNLFVNIQVSVPFLGTIFNQNFPNPPISSFPPGGLAGMSIKRNGHILIGIPDGNYLTLFLKGAVGP